MGLTTIDPHSHKVQTKLYKIHKIGVNRPNSKQDRAKKCMAIRTLSEHNVRTDGWYISLLILTFLNRCISVKTSLINTKLGDIAFVNLDVLFKHLLFLTICGWIVANPIIYSPVPSPSHFKFAKTYRADLRRSCFVSMAWNFFHP